MADLLDPLLQGPKSVCPGEMGLIVMHQAVSLAGPGSRAPWHQGPVLGGMVQVHACPQFPQSFLLSLLVLGVAGRIIPCCGVRALSSVHCLSVFSPALTSGDLAPKLQQLRGSRRLGPKQYLGWGGLGEKSHSTWHLLSLFRWRRPGAAGGPCLVLGCVGAQLSSGHGNLGAGWGGVARWHP